MMDSIKNYIDSFYDNKVVPRKQKNGGLLSWAMGSEEVSTIYKLCNDINYFPKWYPELCLNYEMEIMCHWEQSEQSNSKRADVCKSGYEKAQEFGDEQMISFLKPQESYGRVCDYKTGISFDACNRIMGYHDIDKLNLDFEDVQIRQVSWEMKNYGYRFAEGTLLKTKIGTGTETAYDIEWFFPNARCEMDLKWIGVDAENRLRLSASLRSDGFGTFALVKDLPVGNPLAFRANLGRCEITAIKQTRDFARLDSSTSATPEEYDLMLTKIKEKAADKNNIVREWHTAEWKKMLYGMQHEKHIGKTRYQCEHCCGDVFVIPVMDKKCRYNFPYNYIYVCKECLAQLADIPVCID